MASPRGRGEAIDWPALARRVDAVAQHLTGEILSPEQSRRLLEQRAATLAHRHDLQEQAQQIDVVTFTVGQETYAIEARYVAQMLRRSEVSPLPGARMPVVGVTAWRGGLLTLLDLRAAIGLAPAPTDGLGWIVVLGLHRPEFGVLVDGLRDVATLTLSEIQAPPTGGAIAPEFLRGITASAVLVLDAPTLLLRHQPEPTGVPEG